MWAVEPLLLGVGMWADVLVEIPTHFHNGEGILVKVLGLKAWLVKQYEQVPVRAFVPVAKGLRTVEVYFQLTTEGCYRISSPSHYQTISRFLHISL